ncbi:1,6-anhydro-N-acetylmuramyl-L-alanine amidase AmpD [Gammaproteobacteria bacterium]|nr:1,6-anhydro-N-acetylmuramyl-L-alanine amidase AmpD [Gammaproteobacteria bacterium]
MNDTASWVLNRGWLSAARIVPSPNYDARPSGTIDALVVHCISLPPGCYDGNSVEQFFQNQLDPSLHPYFAEIADLTVSAHFFIRRDGELLQFVNTDCRAWHAGVSRLAGRDQVNDFSVGVELEGMDNAGFDNAQYDCLSMLTRCLQSAYPALTGERIVGHSEIAPERKSDPGPWFDWPRYWDSIGSSA